MKHIFSSIIFILNWLCLPGLYISNIRNVLSRSPGFNCFKVRKKQLRNTLKLKQRVIMLRMGYALLAQNCLINIT